MTLPRKLVLGVAAAILWSGCSARSASVDVTSTPWAESDFTGRRWDTDHFVIHSTLADAEFEAAVPAFLESAYGRYEQTFAGPPPSIGKLTTYVFGSRVEWERFTRRRYPARADLYGRIRSGGFTEGTTAVLFFVNRSATLATLAHEGWHQYVSARFDFPLPAWLNEGLACYHEAVEWSGATPSFTPDRNSFRLYALREALQRGELIPLRELLETDAGEIIRHRHPGVSQTYYAQAWALVTFLRHGAGGRHAKSFDRLLADMASGAYRVHAGAARLSAVEGVARTAAVFESYFNIAPDQLEPEYRDHIVRVAGF